MRLIPVLLFVGLFAAPALAAGQNVVIHGAAGPTLSDAGWSVVAGVGVSTPHVTLTGNVERSHLVSRRQESSGSVSYFRGGTFTLAAAEVRLSLFGRDRISPYALAGFGVGRSRPNVTDVFPTPAVHSVRAPFAGGGVHVPFGPHATFYADVRLSLIVGTDADDLYALAPLRAGLSWRF